MGKGEMPILVADDDPFVAEMLAFGFSMPAATASRQRTTAGRLWRCMMPLRM